MNKLQINKYIFHIGSNNKTHKREIKKALNICSEFVKGFNASLNIGFWKNQKENSFKIEVLNTPEINTTDLKMFELKKNLEIDLKQYVVLLEKQNLKVLN